MAGDTSGVLQLATNGSTTAVTVDASQRVGIGTTSPSEKLSVAGAITATGQFSPYNGATVLGYIGNDNSISGGTGTNLGIRSDTVINFATGGATERMRIDSSGNVLVGTASGTGYKVRIKSGNGDQLLLDNAGQTYTQLIFANNGTNKADQYLENSTTRFYIRCNGTGGVYLASGGTSWTSASDARVKDIIEPIDNAVQKLESWQTVIGKYKTDEEGTRRPFLIAQDVLATFPEAVDTTNEEEYGLRYQDTIPLLVAAIQEQQTIINDLKARITALEGAA
jgi:hypothetical protein